MSKGSFLGGYKVGINEANKKLEKEYQRGANDAWECIKKINHLDYRQMDEIFDIDCGGDWIFAFDKILKEYSPLEAISLVRECELKKKEENKEKVVKIADVLNDINDVLNKYNLEVVSYDTTSIFTDISLDWQLGVKARFDIDKNEEE